MSRTATGAGRAARALARRAPSARPRRLAVSTVALVLLVAGAAPGALLTVPDDHATIQAALNAAFAGDTVQVRQQALPYAEKIVFPRSGDAVNGFITLTAFPGDAPVLDGTGVPGDNMVLIENRSYVRLRGFELRNNLGVNDGSGVRVLGAGAHIEILDNRIHDIRGADAMGITVYGTEPTPISELVIDGNQIYDCDPFRSEALTLNGNVTGFAVTNNLVRDVNNIGIDFIGGETDIQPDPTKVARNGVCRDNVVLRANQQGGGYAGGIYVDGGRDIVIERNLVAGADLGIEIGAENPGIVTQNIVVRDNVLYGNLKVGLVFGGFQASVGRVRDSQFLNNTLFQNDTAGEGFGELWIQFAEDNLVRNNVLYSTAQNVLVYSESGNVDNVLDYNLFFAAAGAGSAQFVWQGTLFPSFAAYRAGTGQDAHSLFGDPQFVDAGAADFHLRAGSPAVDGGDPAFVAAPGETDLDGAPRVSGARVDLGADELTCGNGATEAGEQCDDANPIEGDGCDSNCTFTACGNRIVSPGEACDDGNTAAGDCCSGLCTFEPSGGTCDDGDICTNADACDGGGVCTGSAAPLLPCKQGASGKGTLILKDAANDAADLLSWKLVKGEATSLAELADPVAANGYTLCVYDAAALPQPRLSARAPAGSSWRASGSGFSYRSPSRTPDGLMTAKLKAGTAGKTKLLVKGKGTNLSLPSLPSLAPPLVVQWRRSGGGCWGATFSSPTTSTPTLFKAKSD